MPELAHKTVVDVVTRECGSDTHYAMDDLASGLIAKIWLKKIEFKDTEHLRRWVRRCIQIEVRDAFFRRKRLKNFSELLGEGEIDNEVEWIERLITPAEGRQFEHCEVKRIKKLARSFPLMHRSVIQVLSDGGSILDVHKELGLTPFDALRYLAEIREFLNTGSSTPNMPKEMKRAA